MHQIKFKSCVCFAPLQVILFGGITVDQQTENCLFANKIEFFGKWLHPRAKLKKTDPT